MWEPQRKNASGILMSVCESTVHSLGKSPGDRQPETDRTRLGGLAMVSVIWVEDALPLVFGNAESRCRFWMDPFVWEPEDQPAQGDEMRNLIVHIHTPDQPHSRRAS